MRTAGRCFDVSYGADNTSVLTRVVAIDTLTLGVKCGVGALYTHVKIDTRRAWVWRWSWRRHWCWWHGCGRRCGLRCCSNQAIVMREKRSLESRVDYLAQVKVSALALCSSVVASAQVS